MNMRNLSDYEFQQAMEALPSYNYDLALEIDGFTSVSQVPDDKWEEFVSFYEEYKQPKTNKIKNLRKLIPFIILGLIILALPRQYVYAIGSVGRVNGLFFVLGIIWFRFFKERKLNPILKIFNNYFLAWTSFNKYKGKTNRIEFWHFYLFNIFIFYLIKFFAGYSILDTPHGFFETNGSLKLLSSQYSLASNLVVSIPLVIRRIRDIGKRNIILWFFLSLIPIYGFFIYAKPSFNPEK